MKAVFGGRVALFLLVALGGCAADLATKSWIFARLGMPPDSETLWLIDGVLGFTTSLNEGALFGIGQGRGAVFIGLSLAAVVGIVAWLLHGGASRDRQLTVALALVTGGILGNLYDRLGLPGLIWQDAVHAPGSPVYAVRDWIHFQIAGIVDWPIFNLADGLLVCGAALLAWHSVVVDPGRSQKPSNASTA
jgi:signal peptidase II